MQAPTPEAIRSALSQNRPDFLEELIESDLGRHVYTFALKLCLDDMTLGKTLFENSIQNAILRPQDLNAVDQWLYAGLHRTWESFYRENIALSVSTIPFKFDWNRVDVRQGLDAFRCLDGAEREIFGYRFLLKMPPSWIKKVTGWTDAKILSLFESALKKLVVS